MRSLPKAISSNSNVYGKHQVSNGPSDRRLKTRCISIPRRRIFEPEYFNVSIGATRKRLAETSSSMAVPSCAVLVNGALLALLVNGRHDYRSGAVRVHAFEEQKEYMLLRSSKSRGLRGSWQGGEGQGQQAGSLDSDSLLLLRCRARYL